MIISLRILLVSLLASFFHLDSLVIGQFMISRPIVVGGILGYFLGIPNYGLLIGALFELLYVREIPVGVKIPVDATSSTIFAVVGFYISKCLVMSLIFGFFIGFVYRYIDVINRSINSIAIGWVDIADEDNVIKRINLLVLYSILATYLKNVLFYLISFSLLGYLLYEICNFLIGKIYLDINSFLAVLPAVGIGIVIVHFVEK